MLKISFLNDILLSEGDFVRFLFLIAGGLLFLLGAIMTVVSNFNLGIVLTIALGLFFVLWGAFYKIIKEKTKSGVLKYVKLFVVIVIVAEAGLTVFLAVYGEIDNVTYGEDAIIVLGAGVHGENVSKPLALRLRAAEKYYEKNKNAIIIVSGGKGFQESISEAEAMEKYLLSLGVPEEKIIKEDNSHSTAQNMEFSKQILDEMFDGKYSVAVVTNNFHIFRAVSIAKEKGLENVSHYHAGLNWYNIIPCYLRESLAVLKHIVIGG
jgi:uncharacterized SAM-binding protein YcdF (DUF218 family)